MQKENERVKKRSKDKNTESLKSVAAVEANS